MFRLLRTVAVGVHVVEVTGAVLTGALQWYPVIEFGRFVNDWFAALPADQPAALIGLRRPDRRKVLNGIRSAVGKFAGAAGMGAQTTCYRVFGILPTSIIRVRGSPSAAAL